MAINRPTTDPWPSLIAQWKLSGLTQAEFCRRRGLPLPTFRYHLYKPGRRSDAPRPRDATHTTATPLFLPLVGSTAPRPGDTPPPTSPIEVILPDGLRVAVTPGFDAPTLRRVVDALGRPSC